MRETIDLNCDLGESFGNWRIASDAEIIPLLTAANVACGFHAGDPLTMLESVRLCDEAGVGIGAHPGLPDLLGFGRRVMATTAEEIYSYFLYQFGALQGAMRSIGSDLRLAHSKAHGALTPMLREREDLADAAAAALSDIAPNVPVYWPATMRGAFPEAARRRGLTVVGEVNPDLAYDPTGAIIIDRHKKPADLEMIASQIRQFLTDGSVSAIDGSRIEIEADTIGIHGDVPNAVDVAKTIRRVAEEVGCRVERLAISKVAA